MLWVHYIDGYLANTDRRTWLVHSCQNFSNRWVRAWVGWVLYSMRHLIFLCFEWCCAHTLDLVDLRATRFISIVHRFGSEAFYNKGSNILCNGLLPGLHAITSIIFWIRPYTGWVGQSVRTCTARLMNTTALIFTFENQLLPRWLDPCLCAVPIP